MLFYTLYGKKLVGTLVSGEHAHCRKGDLVMLKGRSSDHLSRIFFAQFGAIGCWKEKCSRRYVCDLCEDLRPQFDPRAALAKDY